MAFIDSMIFWRKKETSRTLGGYNLAKASDIKKIKKLTVELDLMTQSLTKSDIQDWRNAWQVAISVENPQRSALYRIYTDAMVDLHLSGCIGQRMGFVKKKSFKLVGCDGKENKEATQLFESRWFKDFVSLALESVYWGHTLIELGEIIVVDGKMRYKDVKPVPRHHVIPEYGVVVPRQGDDWMQGISYREGNMANWCIEVGGSHSLGLLLKLCPQTIAKKNMEAFWNQWGEMFGMPIRIGKTTSRDEKDIRKMENMLDKMGAFSWGLFPEGTEIEIKETTRGDAFNVYDRRIERANSEMSKGVNNQTMTIDNGSSLSQSQVHLEVFGDVVDSDADMIRDLVNDELIPRMISHGFPIKGLRLDWDENIDYTPEQQVAIETMLINNFEVDHKYFIEKYNIPLLQKKPQENKPLFFD
ncbi:MAG: DUF935 domain-containing protein [Tannerellaceae bacterium]|jgi:hypothetical protein|nr:DUF935 domain-containing protein [Tannerellaceae bacterium]